MRTNRKQLILIHYSFDVWVYVEDPVGSRLFNIKWMRLEKTTKNKQNIKQSTSSNIKPMYDFINTCVSFRLKMIFFLFTALWLPRPRVPCLTCASNDYSFFFHFDCSFSIQFWYRAQFINKNDDDGDDHIFKWKSLRVLRYYLKPRTPSQIIRQSAHIHFSNAFFHVLNDWVYWTFMLW